MAGRSVVSVSMPLALAQSVKELAEAKGEPLSVVICDLIRGSIDKEKTVVAAFGNPTVSAAIMKAFAEPGVLRALTESMRASMSDQQLLLFNEGMQAFSQQAQKVQQPASAKRKRRVVKPWERMGKASLEKRGKGKQK